MLALFKKMKKQELFTILFVYIVFLIIGIISFRDFGISVDEWELRILGFSNLKYVMGIFFESKVNQLNNILNIPDLSDYLGTHGAIFAMPMAFIEYYFNITDSQKYYFFRHYTNHLIFLISNFYFFLLVKERFNNWKYGIFGAIFLFLSPRIFAESFYNHKDIIFLSLFIINIYYGIRFIKKTNFKNSFYFSLITALSIDIRIMGIIIIPIIIYCAFMKNLKSIKNDFLPGFLLFSFLLPLFIIIFWPYLWENPIINFIKVFSSLSSFPHEGYNFYFGQFHLASHAPWHYVFVWIAITTPLFYLFLFMFGFWSITKKIILNNNMNNFWNNNSKIQDLIYYFLFISPIFIIILLNSTIYNGWRHLYFIYPCLLMISITGIDFINDKYVKNRKFILETIILIFLIPIGSGMIKNHPHQNVFFNIIAGNNIEKNFEMDYWGISNKQALEFILKNEKKDLIKIGSAGPISLENSKKILSLNKRKRLEISNNKEADYIINNYINWHGNYKKERYKIPSNFKVYKEISAGGIRIITIYKKT